jgi:aspartyl-tRNA(Asn)/glutamyl-tRNA(Gln) amidotransferase subunit C
MSKVSVEDVQKIAKLARLRISDEEAKRYQTQLLAILESMGELAKLDVSKVAPTSSVLGLSNVTREDAPEPFAAVDKLLNLAPEREGPYYRVKKVLGE